MTLAVKDVSLIDLCPLPRLVSLRVCFLRNQIISLVELLAMLFLLLDSPLCKLAALFVICISCKPVTGVRGLSESVCVL